MPFYFGKSEDRQLGLQGGGTGLGNPPPAPGPGHQDNGGLPPVQPASGLAFTEFMEALASVAVVGMLEESYDHLFPTPFSKVTIAFVWSSCLAVTVN